MELVRFSWSKSFISSHKVHPMGPTKMGFQLINTGIHCFTNGALMNSGEMYLHVVPLVPDGLRAHCAEIGARNLGIGHENVLRPQRAAWKRRENYQSLPSLSGVWFEELCIYQGEPLLHYKNCTPDYIKVQNKQKRQHINVFISILWQTVNFLSTIKC